MVNIWLMMVKNNLVVGISTPLKHMKVSWDDYSQYMDTKNVPNHQPVMLYQWEVTETIKVGATV